MKSPISLDTAEKALSFISPDDRDTWIRMGMALKAEFGDQAQDVWLDWSSRSDRYDAGAAKASWKSFKLGGRVGIGSLIAEAKVKGFTFDAPETPISAEQLAAEQKAREERAAKVEKDRIARAEAAARRAQSQWRMADKHGESPYLDRKQVLPESCRFLAEGGIIIPMIRYDLEPPVMVGKQEIRADGSKKYSGGMDKHGAACRLGAEPVDGDIIIVVEGYATGLSVRMAVDGKFVVFVAFDAVGLLHVAKILRGKYPNSLILFCADDDYLTGNKGLEKANAAADAVGRSSVLLPVFTAPRRASKNDESLPALTDFNDLHVAESLEAARSQIMARIDSLSQAAQEFGLAPEPAAAPLPDEGDIPPAPPAEEWAASKVGAVVKPSLETLLEHFALIYGTSDVWDGLNRQKIKRSGFASTVGKELARTWMEHEKRRTIDPDALPVLRRGRAIDGGGGGDRLLEMLDRLWLLYGTVTVWDNEKRMVMSLDAVRAAYGSELVKRWQEHQFRKMIDADNLVFDPTQRLGQPTHINMFHGYPLTPVQDDEKCLHVLDLLYDLCGSEENAQDIGDWLIKWLAYPLQHPGAKMQTAVLMFGEKQGTGKSLFFEGIVRPIYGEYGGTAGQHQLDSSFTDWKSRKTFMVFEEVLSRDDRYSHIGTLKHMITGRDMRINPKGLPERVESNHLNSAFLSNESQPIPIELEDRRFLVIEARNKLTEERVNLFRKLMAEGLSAIFYHFLLNYPLGDFNPHTKPPMTEAKRKIIRFGRPGWDAFHEQWKDGDLAAPYCSCISDDLYKVYTQWCERNHERKLSLTKFSELIAGREEKTRKRVTLAGSAKAAMRTVFLIPSSEYEKESLEKQCQIFRDVAGLKEAACA
jgi:putative DNA primase/helicase